ncbi:aminotransferase class I/II-fold pyridoxal phosphate-dependent enzyme [Streptomyces cyaneofuscatus]|uniref:aminotransferase class I/II-fold pyridoxal phosphate-dependent enzyme n=1 Tax=Streptomyces cyaneofuscatus TaxID=66883 RepID=UPI0036478C36
MNTPTVPRAQADTGTADNWVARRSAATTGMYDRAVQAGLTGHTVTGRQGKTLTLDDGSRCVEFVSCSYLGLEDHPRMVHAVRTAVDAYGIHLSSSRNSMQPAEAVELEELLGQIYPGLHALVFNSVSSVHLGLLPLLGANVLPSYPVSPAGPLYVVERTAHASMQVLRGVLEQLGPVTRFTIQDPESLAAAMGAARASGRTPVILVDGIGSMGGLIDVARLQETAERHGGYVYIDDAHGTSIDGPRGAGYAHVALGGQVPANTLLVGSLSKAFGGSGGFVLTHAESDLHALRREGNTMVFGHSNMVTHMAANAESARMHLDGTVAALQADLWAATALFDELLAGANLVNSGTRSPIRGLALESEEAAFATAVRLREAGVLCFPVFYPIVAQGTGLLRFALSSTHTPAQIKELAALLGAV